MKQFIVSLMILGAVLGIATPRLATAGCKSNCQDEYESDVDSCKLLNDEPADADSLKSCIDSAKSDFDSCEDECNS